VYEVTLTILVPSIFAALSHNLTRNLESKRMKSRVELERGDLWRDTAAGFCPLPVPRSCSPARGFAMDHAYLSERVKALQRELSEIAEHNRQYFAKRSHSPTAKARYKELRERLYQIHSELHALLDSSEARKRTAA